MYVCTSSEVFDFTRARHANNASLSSGEGGFEEGRPAMRSADGRLSGDFHAAPGRGAPGGLRRSARGARVDAHVPSSEDVGSGKRP